jgi:hypothetical protein
MLGNGSPGEVKTPPKATYRETACAAILQSILVNQVDFWAQHGSPVLGNASQQRLEPVINQNAITQPRCTDFIFNKRVKSLHILHSPACLYLVSDQLQAIFSNVIFFFSFPVCMYFFFNLIASRMKKM